MQSFELESEGITLHLSEYLPEGEPIGVIQIAHGMEEHRGRYTEVAEYFRSRGFIVFTADMRGHGDSLTKADLGWFADRDGWKLLLADQLNVRSFIAEKYPTLPIFLLAHSMSSIITRVLLKTESKKWAKVALIGYPSYNRLAPFGIFFSSVVAKLFGSRYKSKFLKLLTIRVFNRKIKRPTSDYDWISLSRENIDAFLADSLCGFGFTISGMRDLFTLVKLMHNADGCENIRSKLPILLLSGAHDPCTGDTDGRRDSYELLQLQGFTNITVMTLPGMSHEILHEADRQTAFNVLGSFFEIKLEGKPH